MLLKAFSINTHRSCHRICLRWYAQNIGKREHTPSTELMHVRRAMLQHPKYVMWKDSQITDSPTATQSQYVVDFADFAQRYSASIETDFVDTTDEQLIEAVKNFVYATNMSCSQWSLMRKVLGMECAVRCERWNTEQLLLVGDIWCSMLENFQTKFSDALWNVITDHVPAMSTSQLVQAIFIAARNNEVKSRANVFDERVIALYKEMSMDELGIVALSYTRMWFVMHTDVITHIYERLLDERVLETMHDMTLVSFLKVRYS